MKIDQEWKTRYRAKVFEADEAVRLIKPGDRIFVGTGAAEPQALVSSLVERSIDLVDTEIIHIMTLGGAPYTESRFTDVFRHNAFFIGDNVRDAIGEGRADYTPVFLSEIPRLLYSGRLLVDVALIQVSPPDIRGFCTFGISVDIVKSAAENASLVIAEVNPFMPRTFGDTRIHVDQITCLVDQPSSLLESVPQVADTVASRIGEHVAQLVENGATLQIGIGYVPNAVLQALRHHQDLGVHTEMLSDGIIDLIEAGAITCSKKTMCEGKVVTSFCVGSRRLYDYVDNNPFFEFHPVEFTNDPFLIARNKKMVAINSALEVDLTGQVCADSIGSRFYSGIGGLVDFVRGAARSDGGKAIIVLPSTTPDGNRSRIVSFLNEGAGVAVTRGDVQFVVTEYGVADLWGRNVRERTLALISIAHPKFREELLQSAKARRLVHPDQIFALDAVYPLQWVRTEHLPDGTEILFRPIRPSDEHLLRELFYTLSDETIYQRFFRPLHSAPHSVLQRFVNLDYVTQMAIVGVIPDGETERIIAVGRYALETESKLADTAFIVHDHFQGRGIGTFLMHMLIDIAHSNGIRGFSADVFTHNHAMLQVFYKSGCKLHSSISQGVYHFEMLFDESE